MNLEVVFLLTSCFFVCFRFKDIDPETGFETQNQKFSHDRRDVYPLHVIPENQDGIQGSCVFFKERKNVTKQIRSKSFTPLVNLEEAQERSVRKGHDDDY